MTHQRPHKIIFTSERNRIAFSRHCTLDTLSLEVTLRQICGSSALQSRFKCEGNSSGENEIN